MDRFGCGAGGGAMTGNFPLLSWFSSYFVLFISFLSSTRLMNSVEIVHDRANLESGCHFPVAIYPGSIYRI